VRKTIAVDQDNIDLLRKQFSELLIASLADFGNMLEEHEAKLLAKFTKAFNNCQNPYKEYGSNKLCSSVHRVTRSARGLPLLSFAEALVGITLLVVPQLGSSTAQYPVLRFNLGCFAAGVIRCTPSYN
jgi:hypothetical protein